MKQAGFSRLQVLSIACVLSVASGSVAPQSPSRAGTSSAETFNADVLNDNPGDINNDFFKQKEDWWKDPFAMFDEDDEEGEGRMKFDSTTEAVEDQDEDEEELLLMTEPELPTIAPEVQPPEVSQPSPEYELAAPPQSPLVQELSAVRTRKQYSVNPLIEQTITAPVEQYVAAEEVRVSQTVVSKFGSILRAVPFAQVLLSFAFVKVVQPVMERIGNEYDSKASAASEKKESDQHRNDDFDDRRATEEEESRYSSRSYEPKPVTRGGAAVSSGGWFRRVFGTTSEATEKLPPARELMDQVEYLQLELATIKSEKESMEREYEKASWQLQETQNEMANLQSTTNYLKAQLRDNQEVMDRAVRAERRKARDELTKMKEAMLQVLQRERQELRAKMMKQTAEVQAMLKDREAAAEKGSLSG